MEGDTTNFFIYRKLSDYPGRVRVIARGGESGEEGEEEDEVKIGRASRNRGEWKDENKA